jgi:hypothetical protein
MRMSAIAPCVCLASLHANVAAAQWNGAATMQLGMGYGQIALSQSILSGTREMLGDASASSAHRGKPPNQSVPARVESALTYISDANESDRIRATMIATVSHNNPALRPQAEQAFAGDAVLKNFDRFMSTLGYSSHNIADDFAMLLLVSWEIATDKHATPGQIDGAERQIHSAFSHSSQLLALSNAQRQEMAEDIAYQIVLGLAAKREYLRHGDHVQLAHLRELAASIMQRQGLDLRDLRLTEQGFSRK